MWGFFFRVGDGKGEEWGGGRFHAKKTPCLYRLYLAYASFRPRPLFRGLRISPSIDLLAKGGPHLNMSLTIICGAPNFQLS